MNKHTPGPWGRIVELGCDVYAISKDPESHTFVAECAIEGDAIFIAAAPAMYEALREAQELIRSLVAEEMIHSSELQRVGNCQANMWQALSQAEGRHHE